MHVHVSHLLESHFKILDFRVRQSQGNYDLQAHLVSGRLFLFKC